MEKILLTIGIPTRNRCDFLPTIIKSLIAQIEQYDFAQSVEIIIADNASTDSTSQLLRNFCEEKEFMHSINHKMNVGIDENVKSIIEKSRGKFIWFLGDDDDVYTEAVREVYNVLNQKNSIGGVLFGYDVYDKLLDKKIKTILPSFDGEINFKKFITSDYFLNSFLSITVIKNPKLILNKNYIKQDLWLGSLYYHSAIQLMMAHDGIYILKKPIIKFRSGMSTLGAKVNAAIMPSIIAEHFSSQLCMIDKVKIHETSCKKNLIPFVLSRKLTSRLSLSEGIILFKQDYFSFAAWTFLLPMLMIPAGVYKILNQIRKKIKYIYLKLK